MRKWTKLEKFIDTFYTGGNILELKDVDEHGVETMVFTNNQVCSMLDNMYDTFAIRHKDTIQPYEAFLNLYLLYRNTVGRNYVRMYKDLLIEYNPLENVFEDEEYVDGRVDSKHYNKHASNEVNGAKVGNQELTKTGTETTNDRGTLTTTDNGSTFTSHGGSQTTDNYKNAFDSGISADGTHTDKSVTNFGNETNTSGYNNLTHTTNYDNLAHDTSFTNRKDTTSFNKLGSGTTAYKNFQENSHDDVTDEQFNSLSLKKDSFIDEDSYENDKSATIKRADKDGIEQEATLDNQSSINHFIKHRHGNIGVTSNAQLLTGELELRKVDLLTQYVSGFIKQYTTYIGDEE